MHVLRAKLLRVYAEQRCANGHTDALIIALRESMDGKRLRIDAVQTLCAGFVGEALGHALKQAAPAMVRINDGLTALGHLCSRLPFQSNMTDHVSRRVTSNYRNQLSALDLVPVPPWLEHF